VCCKVLSYLSAAGMQGVVYGPGGKYNTMPDERVDIRDIVRATQVYAATAVALTRDVGHRS
jgi:acetylornithine deacetylase